MGGYPSATGVWDVKSPGFIHIIKQLNQGVDWAGNSIGKPTNFLIACAVNPMADDLEYELDWYHQKVEAGADFAITQPLYDLEQLDRFFSACLTPGSRRWSRSCRCRATGTPSSATTSWPGW